MGLVSEAYGWLVGVEFGLIVILFLVILGEVGGGMSLLEVLAARWARRRGMGIRVEKA
jgi:hypothetical protein